MRGWGEGKRLKRVKVGRVVELGGGQKADVYTAGNVMHISKRRGFVGGYLNAFGCPAHINGKGKNGYIIPVKDTLDSGSIPERQHLAFA